MLLAILLMLIPLSGVAQTQPAAPSPAAATNATPGQQPPQAGTSSQGDPVQPVKKDQQQTSKDQQPTSGTQSGTSNDRLFFTLPNFLTLENGHGVPPLSTGEKFNVVLRSSFDYVEYPWYGFLSGLSQAENSEPGYGQGARGYAKRYGAAFTDGTIENFMTGAILPSVFHQDPRYFQNGHGGFWHRAGYAVSRSFVTQTDSGKTQFNYSEILGGALSAGISTYSYHPSADRTVPNTVSVWGTQLGYDTLTLVVKEFWPDIRRKLKKQTSAAAATSTPTSEGN
jgi:hypothetical protein